MDEQMMREKFEAAWDAWGWADNPSGFWDAEHGSYVDGGIQWAWQGFRAALSQPAAQGDSSHSAGGECGGVQRPLTKEQINSACAGIWGSDYGATLSYALQERIARAIESAHGIKVTAPRKHYTAAPKATP